MLSTAPPDSSAQGGYAPFAQLIRMLLPSARCVSIYDARTELVWCSVGLEQLDLRALLEQQRVSETLSGRGRVDTTPGGVPVFIADLRAADTRPLGSIVIELGGGSSRSPPSMVVSLLRPVLDCLESKLDLEHGSVAADRSAGLDLLLRADEQERSEVSALHDLVRHCTRELDCLLGALVVPDKNIEVSCNRDEAAERSQLLDRTQKHLLAWVRLNNRPMIVNRAGNTAPYKILSCPLRDPSGVVLGLVALFRDGQAADFEPRDVRILEYVSRKAVAILESEYDALTGLPNRLIFERRVQRELDTQATALLYVDIDKVAAINEAFGLSAGDEVIQRVGAVIQRAAGAETPVSRVSGDRFAVALPGRGLEEANELARKIVHSTGQLGYLHGGEALQVAVSVGVVAGSAGERLPHVLAAAELACKRAKTEGGARVVTIGESATLAPAVARQALAAAELRDALSGNKFELDAQPIVALTAHAPEAVGYELLVRLRNSAGEPIDPGKFLEACGQYGLLPALDRWVLCAAVEILRPYALALASSPLFFAVNVSAQSLESRKYAAFALDALAAAGLPPSLFCFELKEAAAVGNIVAADALIRELTSAGAKLALDDFGSGLSSLAHLKRLPVSYLKIDGRFVRRMGTDRIAESIVSGIARAAQTLGVTTVAEHVESAAVADRLRELDVALGQGFHFGRPEPFAKAVQHAVPALPMDTSARA